ncbi:MAG: calcium-binding EGF-like domain-containing protein [Deltaproteobacteria bacterium]|nr:calcium-binding EGF-like domain-containing protein [Deltaproteobacteria bacterium]
MDPCEELACVNGSCTDEPGYFICHCDPGWAGPQCDMLGMPFCLRGQLTIQDAFDMVNGTPATGAFEPFEGATIDFNFRFDVANHSTMVGDGMFSPNGQLRIIETGPMTLEFSEAWFTDVFGAAFADTNQVVTLVNGDFQGIHLGNWVSPEGPEYWGFELTSGPLPLVIGEDGYPALLPSINPGEGSPILRRYQNMGPLMSDYAATTWSVQLLNGDDCL